MANQVDAAFVAHIGPANTAEITEANLALQRSPEFGVRLFAERMITDHTALGSQLTQVAAAAGFSVPTQPVPNAKDMDALAGRSGVKFDNTYLAEQMTDHQQVSALLNVEASQGQDPGLVNFAKQAIPMIQSHFDEAQILYADLIPNARITGVQTGTMTSSAGAAISQSSPASYSMGTMLQETNSQGAMAMSQDQQVS